MVSKSDKKDDIWAEYEKVAAELEALKADGAGGDSRYEKVGRLTAEWLDLRRNAEVAADDWKAREKLAEIEALVDN